MSQKIQKLFPTIIASGTLKAAASFNTQILREIHRYASEDKMGQAWSEENYWGGYTSYASLSDMHHRTPLFSQFEESMQPQAEAFAKAQGWKLRGAKLVMTHCWMNIMPQHTHHTLHLHPHSVISGAYFVQTPKGSVPLKLEDPRMSFYMNAPLREGQPAKESPLYHHVQAVAGNYLLFESWLRHEVPPNRSKTPRISLSFNYSIE